MRLAVGAAGEILLLQEDLAWRKENHGKPFQGDVEKRSPDRGNVIFRPNSSFLEA